MLLLLVVEIVKEKKNLFIIAIFNQQAQVGEVYPTQSICRDERQSLLHKSYNLIKNTCECVGSIYAAGKRKSHQITRIIDTVQNLLATICIIGILSVLYLLLFYMLSKI